MGEIKRDRVTAIARRMLPQLFPDAIGAWLFGSVARDDARPGSDVDLAVWCGARVEPLRRMEAQRDLEVAFDADVDLVDLAAAGPLLRLQALHDGVLLMAADPAAVTEFHARSLGEHADWLEATRDLREAIRDDGIAWRQP